MAMPTHSRHAARSPRSPALPAGAAPLSPGRAPAAERRVVRPLVIFLFLVVPLSGTGCVSTRIGFQTGRQAVFSGGSRYFDNWCAEDAAGVLAVMRRDTLFFIFPSGWDVVVNLSEASFREGERIQLPSSSAEVRLYEWGEPYGRLSPPMTGGLTVRRIRDETLDLDLDVVTSTGTWSMKRSVRFWRDSVVRPCEGQNAPR